jgi:hypothetical protein
MVTTSNFGIANMDQSTFGRLEFVSFSDYYHLKIEGDNYLEKRTPRTEFGDDFFEDTWFEKQKNMFYHFLFECCQFYLQNTENNFEAPKNNIYKTNSQALMGNQFMEWANNYFYDDQSILSENSPYPETIEGTLNKLIPREELYNSYVKTVGEKFKKTAQNFKKSLKEYCKTKDYDFNPELHKEFSKYYNKEKYSYILGVSSADGKRKTSEHFALCTKEKIVNVDINPNEF